MTEPAADIEAAVARLAAFADQFEAGLEIDEVSGLTTDDIDLIVARVTETKGVVSIQQIDLSRIGDLTKDA